MRTYTLKTPRLRLRPLLPHDVEEWTEKLFTDPDVMRHMPQRDLTPRQDAERAYNGSVQSWATHGFGGWAIINKSDGAVIGRCGLGYVAESGEVELGYTLAQAYWGKGLATETARACVRFGFETATLAEIIAVVVPENIASWRVLERVGFVFVKNAVYYALNVAHYRVRPAQFQYGDAFYYAHPLDE